MTPIRLLTPVLLLAWLTPLPALAAINVTGALMSGDTLVTGNRLTPGGTPSACGTPKPFPGPLPGAPGETGVRYDEIGYTNTGPAQCVSFQITGNCAPPGVQLSAYSGPLNPADVSVGYLGDAGLGSDNNIVRTLSLDMASGQSVNLIVSNAALQADGSPQTCAWRVTSTEPLGTGASVASVPTQGAWALALMGLLAAGLGGRSLRRKA